MNAIRNSGLSKLLAVTLALGGPVAVAVVPFAAGATTLAEAHGGAGSLARRSHDRTRRAGGHQQRMKRHVQRGGAVRGAGAQAPALSTPASSR